MKRNRFDCAFGSKRVRALPLTPLSVPVFVGITLFNGVAMSNEAGKTFTRLPVKVMPLLKIDPPRTVRAENWNGAFCAEWTDECTICAIAKNGSRTCRQQTAKNCQIGNTRCTTVRNDAFNYCKEIKHILTRYFKDGSTRDDPAWSLAKWVKTAKGYTLKFEDETIVRQRSFSYQKDLVRSENDAVCIRAYNNK